MLPKYVQIQICITCLIEGPGRDDPENEKLRLKAQICRNCDTVKAPLRSNVTSLGL